MTDAPRASLVELPDLAVLEVTGKDRARFLQGMCTQDVASLAPGAGRMAAFATRQGKMVAMGVALATDSTILFTLDARRMEPLAGHLSKFIVTDDVALKDAGRKVLHLYGPGASDILAVGTLADFHHAVWGEDVRVSRNRTLTGDGYDLLVPTAQVDAVRKRLTGAGAQSGSTEALEAMRIASGFPRWGVDIDEDLLPMEAGLDDAAISYTKGCYIGQEVIQRVKTYSEPPRMVVSIRFEGETGAPADSEVFSGGTPIGKITSAAGTSAIALVRKEHKIPGTAVTAGDASGEIALPPWRRRLS